MPGGAGFLPLTVGGISDEAFGLDALSPQTSPVMDFEW